jgi:hypothetical protein
LKQQQQRHVPLLSRSVCASLKQGQQQQPLCQQVNLGINGLDGLHFNIFACVGFEQHSVTPLQLQQLFQAQRLYPQQIRAR